MYEIKKVNQTFQLIKDDEIIGVFRNEAVLENTLKRLEAADKPAPVEKPRKKKEKKWKKKSKNTGQSKS